MVDTPVNSRRENMSDDALIAATGKPWAEWFAILDAAGATALTHPQIAGVLQSEHAVAPWWCQMVTVGFEQARGMRLPGQRADGTFEVGASITLPVAQQEALDAVIDAVSAGLGEPPIRVSRDVKFITAKWMTGEKSSLLATANPAVGDKTSVSLTH
ncbi:hypothetical protein GCM10022381_22420 [Leifsonia kafniensis]|uniref:DUF222 domain-containing protein n=1 Tax=Leifsonia kafniensis TaxID=475957 RepID=A0ABP7KJ77_9MICO